MTTKPVRDIRVAKTVDNEGQPVNKFQVWARMSARYLEILPATVTGLDSREHTPEDYYVWVIIASHDRLRNAVADTHGVSIEPVKGEWLQ